MPRSTTYAHAFQVLLDEETMRKLDALTNDRTVPKSIIMRQLIQSRYAMTIEKKPTCANGGACHCPHTHTHL